MAAASPFRYPGGKGFLTHYLADTIKNIEPKICTYLEPFAGGAGAAINLLQSGVVENIVLNDLDPRIYSAWKAIIEENEKFIDKLSDIKITIENWWEFRTLVEKPPTGYSFELGFATFFLNRTSRAGIITGSGPIGGYKQTSSWKIDARFYRETMIRRVAWLGKKAHAITIKNQDAIGFLADYTQHKDVNSYFFFVDPPYVEAGSRLYFNGMSDQNHRELSEMLQSGGVPNWIVTYDNHPLIRDLYKDRASSLLEVGYSLRRTRKENEILIKSI